MIVKFNPYYKKCSTKYPIPIEIYYSYSSKNENNSKDILSNSCYISKLITEKSKGVKIKLF